ncbi:hypothetical protein C8J56DRAFT_1047483 [Mycena floridula]|nr:hypothetical protein C8J56DRAFT_1047483 [Mycena floridula]
MATRGSQTVEQQVTKLMQRIVDAKLKRDRTRTPVTEAREAAKVLAAEAALHKEREKFRASDKLEEFEDAVKAFEAENASKKKPPVKRPAAKDTRVKAKPERSIGAPPSSPLSAISADEEGDAVEKDKVKRAEVEARLKHEAELEAAAKEARLAAELAAKQRAEIEAAAAAEKQAEFEALAKKKAELAAESERAEVAAREDAEMKRLAAEERDRAASLAAEALLKSEKGATKGNPSSFEEYADSDIEMGSESALDYDAVDGGARFVSVSSEGADGGKATKRKRNAAGEAKVEPGEKRLKFESELNLVTQDDKRELAKLTAANQAIGPANGEPAAAKALVAAKAPVTAKAPRKRASKSNQGPSTSRKASRDLDVMDDEGDYVEDDEGEGEEEDENGGSKKAPAERGVDKVASEFMKLTAQRRKEEADLFNHAVEQWVEDKTPINADLRNLFCCVSTFGKKWSRYSVDLMVHLLETSSRHSCCAQHRFSSRGRNAIQVKAIYKLYVVHGWPIEADRKMGKGEKAWPGKLNCGCNEREAVTALLLFKETVVSFDEFDAEGNSNKRGESMRGMIKVLDPRLRVFFVQAFYNAMGVKVENWEQIFTCNRNSRVPKPVVSRTALLDERIAALGKEKEKLERDEKRRIDKEKEEAQRKATETAWIVQQRAEADEKRKSARK